MDTQWHYIANNGSTIGPVSEAALHQMVQATQISAGTMLWREGQDGWKPYDMLFKTPAPAASPSTHASDTRDAISFKRVLLYCTLPTLLLAYMLYQSGGSDAPTAPSADSEASTVADDPASQIAASKPTDFDVEVERSKGALSCGTAKITPAGDGWGALFSCISGKAETVKFFINEEPGSGKVKNVKFLWNDWFKDRGYGVHADASEADRMVRDLVKLFPSAHDKDLLKAFKGKQAVTREGGGYRFEYTYDRGPAIDERMIIVTPIAGR